MTTILLHGELASLFGPVWKLNVASVGEAIRAIETNKPGLEAYLAESGDRGVDFNVKVNEVDVEASMDNTDNLTARRKIDTIQISPVVRGSKEKWISIVIGIVLIVATYGAYAYAGAAAAGMKMGMLSTMIGNIGIAMALGGISQMIAGTPKIGGQVDDGGTQSNLFNGPENTTTQGGPVPLVYGGPILVGSQVVSAGIFTEDTTLVTTAYPNGSGGLTSYVDGPFGNPNGAAY